RRSRPRRTRVQRARSRQVRMRSPRGARAALFSRAPGGSSRPRCAPRRTRRGRFERLPLLVSLAGSSDVVDAEIDVIYARNQTMDNPDRQILALLVED